MANSGVQRGDYGYQEARESDYLRMPESTYPDGYTAIMTDDERYVYELAVRVGETADGFGNCDHQILKRDSANIMGMGADVERMYVARAYEFNEWGIRSLNAIKQGVSDMQVSQAAKIALMDAFAVTPAANTMMLLELRNEVFDYLLASGASRRAVTHYKNTLDLLRAMAQAGGATALINHMKVKIDDAITKRTAVFAGVAAALQAGTPLPAMAYAQADNVHYVMMEVEWVVYYILRFLCMIISKTPFGRACREWKYIRERKYRQVTRRVWCESTDPTIT